MREISLIKKHKVIKLFFSSLSYDEIAMEVGIGKGSVANIIEDFKAGELPITPNEYIDSLRELAVDIRKQHITVKQLKMYQKIHKKLSEMGVGIEQVNEWLEISQDIATESISAKKFVAAALHLAQLEIGTSHNPESLVAEFEAKSKALNTLKADIVKTTGLKKKATAELDSINKAIIAAQEQYDTQTEELKVKLDDFMAQNQISWSRVNTVTGILEGELAKVELGEKEIEEVTKLIAETGSLIAYIKNLEKDRKTLDEHVLELKEDTHEHEMANIGSKKLFNQLAPQVLAKVDEERALNSQLRKTKLQLSELKNIKYRHAEDVYTAWLILTVLSDPDTINDYDFDRLAEIINGIRLARLGEKPKKVSDLGDKEIYECYLPIPYTPIKEYGIAVEEARKKLARLLVPVVKDLFVPRVEYLEGQLKLELTALHGMYRQAINALSGFPSAPDESLGISGSSKQNTAESAKGVTNMDEQSDKASKSHANILKHSEHLQTGSYYGSAETERARMERDRKFLESLSGP